MLYFILKNKHSVPKGYNWFVPPRFFKKITWKLTSIFAKKISLFFGKIKFLFGVLNKKKHNKVFFIFAKNNMKIIKNKGSIVWWFLYKRGLNVNFWLPLKKIWKKIKHIGQIFNFYKLIFRFLTSDKKSRKNFKYFLINNMYWLSIPAVKKSIFLVHHVNFKFYLKWFCFFSYNWFALVIYYS